MAVYTDRWPRAYALNTVTELELTTSQNIAENYTRVNYVVRVKKINNWNDNWTPSGGSYLTLSIGGKAVRSNHRSSWTTANNSSNSTAIVDSGHVNVPHNADGTRVIDYRMELNPNVATIRTMPNRVISGSFRAAAIPRASSFTVNSSTLTTGSNYTVSITRASTDFTHRVYRRIGGSEVELTSSAVATSCVINMPHSLFNSFPNSASISASIIVKTFRGTTQVGSSSQNVTISLVSTAVPTFKDMTVSNSDSRPFSDKGEMIRGVSRLTLGTKDVKGSYSSRITSYEFNYQRHGRGWETAVRSSSETYTYPAFSFPENGSVALNVRSRVRDSRGRYSSWVTVRDVARVHYYAPPSIGKLFLRRTGSDLATIQVYRSHSVTPLYEEGNVSSQKNTANLRFQTRQIGSSTDIESEKGRSSSLSTSADWVNLSGSFDASKSYRVRAILSDARQTVYGSWMMIGTESVPLDIGPKGIGVGKIHEAGGATLQVDGDIEVSGGLIGKRLSQGADLNDIKEPGVYHEYMDVGARALKNCPASEAFMMRVTVTPTDRFVYQEITTRYNSCRYVRGYYAQANRWEPWNQIGFTDRPWSPLSVQGGLVKDFDQSAIFAVRNGVGYVKFHNVFLNRVHTGAPFLVSRIPSEYAPSAEMHIALAPAYWVTNVNERMILSVRPSGEIQCIRNTHAGAMLTSAPVALI